MLDEKRPIGEASMIITLYKVGKDGKTHYYTIHDRQPVLDAPYAICASWRVGLGKEREKLHRFPSLLDRDLLIRRLIARRVKDGYKILYTFSRGGLSAGRDPSISGPDGGRPSPEITAISAQ
jgi:hypothetical protein